MKKQIIIAVTVILAVAALCFGSGKYYLFNNKSENEIISLELPPFCDDIVLHEGDTSDDNFFEVVYKNGFSSKDIKLISEDENIATVKYCLTERNRYICYKVTAISVGETRVYFTANDGKIVSEKIKVTVLSPENENSSTSHTYEYTTEPLPDNTEETTEASSEVQTTEKEHHGSTVYIAPSGKRYHYSKSCAGKNAYAVSKADAVAGGRTPCKKCAGG